MNKDRLLSSVYRSSTICSLSNLELQKRWVVEDFAWFITSMLQWYPHNETTMYRPIAVYHSLTQELTIAQSWSSLAAEANHLDSWTLLLFWNCRLELTNSLSLQWRAPWWSVAVSTMRRQSVWSLAFLQAEWITMLTDWTSELTPSARWNVGVRKVSSNDWAVGATPQ